VHKLVAKFDDGKVVKFRAFGYDDYTQDLAAGDKIHVGITFSGGNQNTTHDLTIQLDMF